MNAGFDLSEGGGQSDEAERLNPRLRFVRNDGDGESQVMEHGTVVQLGKQTTPAMDGGDPSSAVTDQAALQTGTGLSLGLRPWAISGGYSTTGTAVHVIIGMVIMFLVECGIRTSKKTRGTKQKRSSAS